MGNQCSCFSGVGKQTPTAAAPKRAALTEAEKVKKAATEESAKKGLIAHSFGSVAKVPEKPAKKPELWEHFHKKGPVQEPLTVRNYCYRGYTHDELDFNKPVHAIMVDFKADSMQMGMLIQRLVANNEQFCFVGDPLPFNDGWHFTALNDFENEGEQTNLNPSWKSIRIWTRINYIPVLNKDGRPALVPKESFLKDGVKTNYQGDTAKLIGADFKLSTIYIVGGLMAGTLIANVVRPESPGMAATPANFLIMEHLKYKTTFATIGHGLGVLIGTGTREKSAFVGFAAAVLPDQDHLMNISGWTGAGRSVHEHKHSNGCRLVSASFWGKSTADDWFRKLSLPRSAGFQEEDFRVFSMKSNEIVFKLDCPQHVEGPAAFNSPAKAAKVQVMAVLVDYRFDPVEAYAAVKAIEMAGHNYKYQFISHSTEAGEVLKNNERMMESETVFGNAFYGLHDCYMAAHTTPADKVPENAKFVGFAIVGGQGPFHMMGDKNMIRILNKIKRENGVGAAVCHGPMVLIGSDFIPTSGPSVKITSFNGAWIYFRDILAKYVTEKPGHIEREPGLITGNSPAAAESWSAMITDQLQKNLYEE